MGILNNFLDKFKNAEFTVAPQKKLKTISADFKKAFELSLVFYKGVKIADPELTLASLNNKTSKTVNTHADGLKIKASMKVGDAERLFDTNFGVTEKIKANNQMEWVNRMNNIRSRATEIVNNDLIYG